MKKKISMLMLAGCMMASMTACGGTDKGVTNSAASGDAQTLAGNIVLYTSQPEEDVQILIDGFNEQYPDITVDVFRSGTEEVVSKVLAENEADSVQADVLLVSDSVTFETLNEQGILEAYKSPELEGIPEEYIDDENMYTGTKIITTGIMYNTDMVDEPITSFNDLTDEKYKDNIIMPSPLYSGSAAYNVGVMSRTEGLGWEFFEALDANGVTVDKGNGAVQTAVVSGEKACGIIVDYMAIRSKQDGLPVEFVYPEEGSPAITEPIGLVKGSDNAEAAKAFIDFTLSEEGQQLAAEIGYTPVKEGISAPEGLKSIDELTTMTWDISELYQNKESDKEQFSSIFQ